MEKGKLESSGTAARYEEPNKPDTTMIRESRHSRERSRKKNRIGTAHVRAASVPAAATDKLAVALLRRSSSHGGE